MAGIPLDPQARLDFAMEWGPDALTGDPGWLKVGETITAQTVTGTGCTVESSAVVGTQVVAWVKDGVLGAASLNFHVETDQGRIDERTMKLVVKQR